MKNVTTRMGFEPTRAEHNGLAVHRLNHSATSSSYIYIEPSLLRNLNEVAGNNSRQIRNNALTDNSTSATYTSFERSLSRNLKQGNRN